MKFCSILFEKEPIQERAAQQPDFFADLNLDQIIEAIAARKPDYNLKPFFWTHLQDAETIYYRQEVMRDLENKPFLAHINEFTRKMIWVRQYLDKVEKLTVRHHQEGWFLEAALLYCAAVTKLAGELDQAALHSCGFLAFREYMQGYVNSQSFQTLQNEAQKVEAGLKQVRYSLHIEIGKFSVQKYEGEGNYSEEVEKVFEKFKQGEVEDYQGDLKGGVAMNHVEAKMLEFVALLYPDTFADLDRFCAGHKQFIDETLHRFEQEVEFYIAYLDFINSMKHKGLKFCYPQVGMSKEIHDLDGFDLALAYSLLYSDSPVICNDFSLHNPERIIVVTGPNQGGKTTFGRTFGQLHYLASLGFPVPGREASLFLFDRIFSHFERQEHISNLRGKLQDDLVRIHEIVSQATPDSILIMNEIFASTTLEDAILLSKEIMSRVIDLDLLCVWVTFIDELSTFSEKTVSMVSTVETDNPSQCTFKIIRKPADGLAYALSIAEKHRLTYQQIQERLAS
jgi:DNA mismatch repair protein MutS